MITDLLDQLETTGSTNAKLAILKSDTTGLLKRIFNLTYDYRRLYYVKKLDKSYGAPHHTILSDDAFVEAIETWAKTLAVSGRLHETKGAFEDWLMELSEIQAKWARRIILRDLKVGATVELGNKAGFEIPEFEVQLAKDGEKCKKLDKLIKEGLYLTPKLDGYRCFAIIRDGQCELFSRNGTKFENFPMVIEQLEAAFPNGNICLDGEIMSNDFNSMQKSAFASKRGTVVGDMVYHVFDSVLLSEWDSQTFTEPYLERRHRLDTDLRNAFEGYSCLKVVESIPLSMSATLEDIKAVELTFTLDGYEGVMANPINLPYQTGRVSNGLMKFKTMKDMEARVIGFLPGEIDTKYANTLGKVLVIQENGVECEVGSGFTDADRDTIWADRDGFTNHVITVRYQELTPDGVMRFPVFKTWRFDK